MAIYPSSADVPTGSGPVPSRSYIAALAAVGGIETPSTLPEITYSWTGNHPLSNPKDIAAYKTAVQTAVTTTANSWRYLDGYNNGGTQRAILIGGPVGSPVEDVRIIIALGNAAPANIFSNTNSITNAPYAAMSPDAGSEAVLDYSHFVANGEGPAGNVGDPFGAANPFGAYRFSGFALMSDDITSVAISAVYIVDSEETITIINQRGMNMSIGHLGATLTPPNDDAAEADGRVYGIHTSGSVAYSVSSTQLNNAWPGHSTNTLSPSAGVWNPAAPASIALLEKSLGLNTWAGILNWSNTTMGPQMPIPIPMKVTGTGNGYGWMRQIGFQSDERLGMSNADVDGVTTSFVISSSMEDRNDALCLLNFDNAQDAPSTLPKLTFSWSAPQALGVPTAIADFKTAVQAAVNATINSWRYLDGYNNGGTQRAVLIGGPVGSPVEDLRIIVAVGNASVLLMFPNNTGLADAPFMAMSPDAGSEAVLDYDHFSANGEGPAGNVGDPFINVNPFGTYRFTGFSRMSLAIPGSPIASVTAIDSLETLALICTRGTQTCISLTGATVVPPDDDAAEPDGRIYGLHTGGQNVLDISLA